jgi:AcrR family transcriptional regulator
VREPSFRHYVRAKELKAAGMDWTAVLAAEDENPRARLVAELLASPAHASTAARVKAFAQQGGGSRATFFNHFGSKTAVFRFYGQQLAARIEAAVADAGARSTPLDRLRRVLGTMAAEAEANREDLRLVFAYSVRDPAYLEAPTAPRQRVLELLAGLIGEAQRRGEAREDIPAQEQAEHLMGLYQNALLGIVFGGRKAETAVDSMWRFARGGLYGVRPLSE